MKNNSLFLSARLKLTAWYLLIIIAISVLFSFVIFTGINSELNTIQALQEARRERIEQRFLDMGVPIPAQFNTDIEEVEHARYRLIIILLAVNSGIIVISGLAGYFLAGRTLRPIKNMLSEQDRFISDASHELRTPLTALRSEIEVALRGTFTLKEAKEILSSNLEEVITMQNLSDNLLRLTQTDNTSSEHQSVSIKSLIAKVLKTMAPLAKSKQITIQSHTSDISVLGDEGALTQLLTILIDNAIKYSEAHTTITISVSKNGQTALMKIHDEGVGMSKHDMDHIFDRFYRADSARSNQTQGFGLGLAIAQKIVSEHQGSMSVESQPNNGTTFTINLQLA